MSAFDAWTAPGTALANAFHGLVHILDVQTEVPNAVSVLVNPI
jgi:hypothetical protein